MRRSYRTAFNVALGLLLQESIAVDRNSHVRSRELAEIQETSTPTSTGTEACRCEYPGEQLYGNTTLQSSGYLTVGSTLVLPSSHEACQDLWFICPDVEFFGTPWTNQKCPSSIEQNVTRRAVENVDRSQTEEQLDGERQSSRPLYSQPGTERNEYITDFHNLVDDRTEYYSFLPVDSEFCKNGGTRIRSGDSPTKNCQPKILSFTKAGDRRPLPGGTSVANEWFPNMGVKITASSDGGPDNMHPVVFDMDNPTANGVDRRRASMLGTHNELGNVLVPLRAQGLAGGVDDYGMLNFDFYQSTVVNYITLLNVDDLSKVFVTQADGTFSLFEVESAGPGGIQTVYIGLEKVVRLTVSFKTFAAVISLDLCIVRPSTGK